MPSLRYPNEALSDTTDYLQIQILNYDRKKITGGSGLLRRSGPAFVSGRGNIKNLQNTILLPMPSNVQDGNSVSYSDSKLDGLTASVYGAIAGGDIDPNDQSNIFDRFKSVMEKAGASVVTQDAGKVFTKNLASKAANLPFNGNLSLGQVLARESGEILNPNMELLFNGVTLRSFRFSFKMTPRDAPEAENIRYIINTLKRTMAPRGSGTFLQTPNMYQLTYKKGVEIHPYLNMFKQCFLTDMAVNYTGEGVYATYSDGSPISYNLDLSFKEIEPVYAGDYNNESANGVGF